MNKIFNRYSSIRVSIFYILNLKNDLTENKKNDNITYEQIFICYRRNLWEK